MLSLKTTIQACIKENNNHLLSQRGGIENKNRSSDIWSLNRSQSDHFTEVKRAEQPKFSLFFFPIQVFASDLV